MEILSQKQQDFLVKRIREIESSTRMQRDWWIGITDEASEGNWLWDSSKTKASFTSWYSTPSSSYNNAYMERDYGYKWYGADSANTGSVWPICQINEAL